MATPSAFHTTSNHTRSRRMWRVAPPLMSQQQNANREDSKPDADLGHCERSIADFRRFSECLIVRGSGMEHDAIDKTLRLREIGAEASHLLRELRSLSQI
jgi:hypothetical protein